MSYTIANLKDDLERKLHGTTLNKLQDPYALIAEAARNVLLKIDPQETKRVTQIENALYDDVYRYPLPDDIKGKKVLDLRPQVNRKKGDNFSQVYNEEFDTYKTNNDFTIEFDDAVKSIRISKALVAGLLLNECDSLTANGTWAASGGASNLSVDELYYQTASASLNFDLDGVTAGVVQNSTMTQVDLSDHDEKSSFFVWVYMPTTVTNVILRWGNDSSNYWSRTVTTAHYGAFQVGWNLLRFDWNGATETGTVAPSTMDYLHVTVTYTGTADTDFRIDSIYSKLPSIWEIVYYSKFLFRSSSGTWIETPTSDSDIVNLDTEAYNVLLYETCFLAAQEIKGEDATFDVEFWENKRDDSWEEYGNQNKSEWIKPQGRYYRDIGRMRRR